MVKKTEIEWEREKNDGWLVTTIVISFLVGIGALIGHVATKAIIEKECRKSEIRFNDRIFYEKGC